MIGLDDIMSENTALKEILTHDVRVYLHLPQSRTEDEDRKQINELTHAILSYVQAFGIHQKTIGMYIDAAEVLDSGTFVGFYQGFRGRALDIRDYDRRKAGDVHLGYRKGVEVREEMKKYSEYHDILWPR